jgi:hypothetical protein
MKNKMRLASSVHKDYPHTIPVPESPRPELQTPENPSSKGFSYQDEIGGLYNDIPTGVTHNRTPSCVCSRLTSYQSQSHDVGIPVRRIEPLFFAGLHYALSKTAPL